MKNYAARSTFLLLLVTIIIGCSSETKQIRREKQLVRSWASSVALIGESWMHGSTTSRFALKALQRSRAAVSKEALSFESKSAQQSDAKEIVDSLNEIASLAGQMENSILAARPDQLRDPIQRLKKTAEQMKT